MGKLTWMNWSYRGSWLETTPPHATRVCRRARPRDTTLLHIVATVPGPPPHHGFSTKTACDQASTPGSGLGLNAGSGDSRRPLSSVRGPRAPRAAPGGGVQAAGPCKCLFSRFFFCLFGCFFFFFWFLTILDSNNIIPVYLYIKTKLLLSKKINIWTITAVVNSINEVWIRRVPWLPCWQFTCHRAELSKSCGFRC